MLERVDTLHSRHLIHRDIKPANFVIGLGDNGANVYCVDFGLSKRYRHPKNLQHIPHRDGRSLTGTPRYASINNHLGIEQSRRDDLESIGYVLVYFLKGSLPWQGLKAKNAQKKYRLILEKKQQVSIAQLCQGCPSQFAEFLAYTRSLKFDAKPDIPYLRKLFRDLYHAQGCGSIGKLWDWDTIDTDYFSTIGTEGAPANMMGPPAMLSTNVPRPSTAAAVAAVGDSDMMLGNEIQSDYDGSRKLVDRPSTAGAAVTASSRQQSGSWGFPGRQGADNGMGSMPMGIATGNASNLKDPRQQGVAPTSMDYEGDPQRFRPHTAHGAGRAAGGGNEEDDAHVVAGARAMMRYRRTRSSAQEEEEMQLQQQQGKLWNGNDQQGINKGVAYQQSKGTGVPSYGSNVQPNTYSTVPYAAVGSQPQQRASTSSGQKPTAAVSAMPTNSGWIGDRPKSAGLTSSGLMNSLTTGKPQQGGMTSAIGGNLQAQMQQQQQQQQQAANNALSYGALKNRFLSSGSKNGSKSSKLFTLSR